MATRWKGPITMQSSSGINSLIFAIGAKRRLGIHPIGRTFWRIYGLTVILSSALLLKNLLAM